MAAASVVQVAVAFVWVGMVLGISFLEAPLKFRAPGITVPIGLGIGRLVFTALNRIELVFAIVLCVALALESTKVVALLVLAIRLTAALG